MKKYFSIATIFLFAVCVFVGCTNRAQKERQYTIKAVKTGELIVNQAHACVNQSKAYQAVWEYARVSDMDFKTAADQMLGPETKQNKATMVEHKAMIEDLLEELKDPPSRFEEMHKTIGELYQIYVQLHDLGMDPLDDMDKHMRSVNELSDQMVEKSRELDAAFVVK